MILVTGGAGYIGSHCVLKLLETGKKVVVFDNLSTGHIEFIENLSGVEFVQGDLKNPSDINNVFKTFSIDAVFHFAGYSQVSESIKEPYKYFQNNVCGTQNLLEAMNEYNCKKIIFSSSAAVYGEPEYTPINETHPINPINPYGETKITCEMIMDDFDRACGIKSVRLRYFNVAGADNAGRTGEWHEPETHLIPNILKSIIKTNKELIVYGNDYPTSDGTCIRDYIDINDLIEAHISALKYLENGGQTNIFNLGSQAGCSVKEVITTCETISGEKISYKVAPRRQGDPISLVADNKKALEILEWLPTRTLNDSIQTAWDWENKT